MPPVKSVSRTTLTWLRPPCPQSLLCRSAVSTATVCVATMVLGLPAHALQLIDVRDGVAVEAVVSIKEATRIRIEGAPITDVFGSVQSSNCGSSLGSPLTGPASSGSTTALGSNSPSSGSAVFNPSGEVILECDRDKGEVYIRPVGGSTKPINLFVASAQATYTLILRRSDTPADTIVLRDRSQPSSTALGAALPSGQTRPLGVSAHPIRALKAMLLAMASGRTSVDIQVEEMNQPVRLWAEATFVLTRRYESRSLVGEAYLLKNVSPAEMVLAEQEFDRPDAEDGGKVLGVAVEHHNVPPGQSTQVFVIRLKGSKEAQP